MRFTALLHHLSIEALRAAFQRLKVQAAAGADGLTWKTYSAELEDNLRRLHQRLQRGSYRPVPARRVYIHGVNRYRSLLPDKSFLLTIRAHDGSTLLETRVEYMHQGFQRLIDWSIDETGQDVCAVITGKNGFYANHRIKASRDFGWIESE